MGTEFTIHIDGERNFTLARGGKTVLSADAGSMSPYETYIGTELLRAVSQGGGAGDLRVIPGTVTHERIPELSIVSVADEKKPMLLLLHGFESSKEKMIRYGIHCALSGFHTVMIDAPYHGSRTEEEPPMFDIAADPDAGWRNRLGLIGEYLRETIMALSDIASRPLIDQSRIAVAGISMGASVAMLAAARTDVVKAALAFLPILDYESIAGTAVIRPEEIAVIHALDPLYACKDMQAAIGLFCGADDRVAGSGARVMNSVLSETPQSDTARRMYREYPGVGHAVTPAMLADGLAWLMRFV